MADWFYGFDAFIHLQDIQSTFANITMNTCHFWINRQRINCTRITLSPSSTCFGDDGRNKEKYDRYREWYEANNIDIKMNC